MAVRIYSGSLRVVAATSGLERDEVGYDVGGRAPLNHTDVTGAMAITAADVAEPARPL